MPNQMIALQARNPQLPDPAAQTAKFVNMMNMTKQQEAAERQAALAQQEMGYKAAQEKRAAETQTSTMRDKDLDYKIKDMNRLRNIGVVVLQTEDPAAREAAYQSLVEMIGQADQQLGDTVRRVAPTFNAKVLQGLIMEADKYTDKKWATPIAVSAVNARTGQQSSLTLGGIDPRAEVVGEVAPENTTPAAAAPTAAAAAPEANPFAADAPPADVAAENVNSLGLVVASARETGVIAQKDVAKLLSVAAPGSGPKLMSWLSQNNIQVVPNAPGVTDNQMRGAPANLPTEMTPTPMAYDGQTPQSQYADLRGPAPQSQTAGLRGAPPMEQTMLQSQGRTPFIPRREAPAPAETPQQAGDRARNIRQTPAEAAAITAAIENTKVGIQRDARLAEETRTKTIGRKLFSKALNDMRGDYNTLNKLRAIPSTGRPMLDNFGDAISSSYLGRKVQSAAGSQASVALNNIANSRLTLLNALKEVTGMSAAQLSSNVELMTFLDSLADPTQGYESAMETIRRLENLYGAPAPAQRQTPTKSSSGWGKAKVVGN